MGCDHLRYEYTGVDDPSRLHEEEIGDKLILERLGKSSKICPGILLA
jgi:hypothetical protein